MAVNVTATLHFTKLGTGIEVLVSVDPENSWTRSLFLAGEYSAAGSGSVIGAQTAINGGHAARRVIRLVTANHYYQKLSRRLCLSKDIWAEISAVDEHEWFVVSLNISDTPLSSASDKCK